MSALETVHWSTHEAVYNFRSAYSYNLMSKNARYPLRLNVQSYTYAKTNMYFFTLCKPYVVHTVQ